jgi:hypothetical protein
MSANRSFNGRLAQALFLAILAIAAAPSLSQAQTVPGPRDLWMAISATEAAISGREFGRLVIEGGVLTFDSNSLNWRLPLSEIKRVGESKEAQKALEIESVSGQVYFVAILDGQLMASSPAKALQSIRRAVKSAPAAPVRAAAAAAGSMQQ